ncbi:hypothetical protein HZA44_04235 [Candidatus Peregrinibacteria bacterium]|nr:hypothetical protein [Candidatus Peregrinibacteria bacterium]
MLHALVHLLALIPLWLYFSLRHYSTKTIAVSLVVGFLVDLDHLLANPIYDPNRCSIGFHPLHTPVAILIYMAGLMFPKTRILSAGLLVHMLADAVDCFV